MKKNTKIPFGILTPNLLNICVDQNMEGEMKGRIYHGYDKESVKFENIIELLKEMDIFYDNISYPQSSTATRTFGDKSQTDKTKPERVTGAEEIVEHSGELGTFLTSVQYRQNSSWQGSVYWVEREVTREFYSTLELLKLIDNALQQA